MRRAICLMLMAAMACAGPVMAQDVEAEVEAEIVADPAAPPRHTDGDISVGIVRALYTFWIEQRGPFPVDTPGEGTEVDDATMGQQQIDLEGDLTYQDWLTFEYGVRVFSGVLFGKQSALAGDEAVREPDLSNPTARGYIIPRKLFVELLTPVGLLRIGHQTSHWGLGILANDSTTRGPLDLFNNRTHGDLVERILFATKPAGFAGPIEPGTLGDAFLLGLAFDLVFRDEIASLLDGDVAVQGVLSLLLRDPIEDDWEVGLYGVGRTQTDDDGSTLSVMSLDFFGRITGTLPVGARGLNASAALETTWLYGVTNRLAPEESPEEAGVNAFGAAFEGLLQVPDPDITFGLKAGFATGDANTDDDTLYRFTFDPDFKAGLILFDHVLFESSARSYEKASDPARAAVPPKGVENFITQNSINSALFLNPMLIYRPVPDITLAVGGLWARATAPVIDPIETFRNGGVPTNPYGVQNDARSLGFELDLLLSYTYPIALGNDVFLPLSGRAEYGVFFFGGAFEQPGGERPDNIHYVSAQLALGWR